MDNMLDLISKRDALGIERSKDELLKCNEFSSRFGLTLGTEEAVMLVKAKQEALKNSGRIEFGESILPKIIFAFCDSPFMEQETFAETLTDLQEAFYYFKTESLDFYTDDEIIDFMVAVFNGRANGSAEYLIGTSLEALIRYVRSGYDEQDADMAGDLF